MRQSSSDNERRSSQCCPDTPRHFACSSAGRCLVSELVLPTGRKTEISDTRVAGYVNEDVVWFQIAMYDPMAMYVYKTLEYLSEELPTFLGGVVELPHD